MRKISIYFAIVMVATSCSSFKPDKSTESKDSDITIALDRAIESDSLARKPSAEALEQQSQEQGFFSADRKMIYQAQQRLKQLGYHPGPLDGIRGPKTQRAIKEFQQDHRLPQTGNLDADTGRQLIYGAQGGRPDANSVGLQPAYSLMTGAEARQLVERHIKAKDIPLEKNMLYRRALKDSESENANDIFQGVKFDDKNYLVLAHCDPAYRLVKSSEDLPDKLAQLNISIPDDRLTFSFNGVFYSTVNLEVKNSPLFYHTDGQGFINNHIIPKGGYPLLIGEFGMNLGNAFIFFQNPSRKNFVGSWRSLADVFMIKMSVPKEKGIQLNFYRD